MSLFKVRNFWSFDLNQFTVQYNAAEQGDTTTTPVEPSGVDTLNTLNSNKDDNNEGNFIVTLGQFHSIGSYDVFVCADLSGFICIVQVPEIEQQKHTIHGGPVDHNNDKENDRTTTKDKQHKKDKYGDSSNNNLGDRQLLVATQLGFPIVDLKCGFFTSALKQSIAVLSFDKLVVYRVKRHQVDLLSGDTSQLSSNSNLFSHELEEHHRIDLLAHEFASNIIVQDNHTDSSLLNSNNNKTTFNTSSLHKSTNKQDHSIKGAYKESSSSSQRIKQVHASAVQQLCLPQRDTIVVQYTNQFIFTILDHKKVAGHFSLSGANITTRPPSSNHHLANGGREDGGVVANHELHIQQLTQYVGFMPMTFLRDSRGPSLVISLSDNKIYSLPLAKLTTQAKQNIMKRVALNLLSDKETARHLVQLSTDGTITGPPKPPSSLSYDKVKPVVDSETRNDIDLDSIADWQFELVCQPIQMLNIQRKHASNSISSSQQPDITVSQLLVMSRYNLDLFSSIGQHLWSRRFETPLICIHTYIMDPLATSSNNNDGQTDQQLATSNNNADRMLTLLCTDCLSADKCNLLILDEDRIAWSALLNTKPTQVWRANLSKMSGILAALDIKQAHLSVSYLGTNLDSNYDDLCSEAQIDMKEGGSQLALMDLLDEPLFNEDRAKIEEEEEKEELSAANSGDNERCDIDDTKQKLTVDVRLEASNQWPNVQVECCVSIRPARESASAGGILQNIIATLEFDDLINFESSHPSMSTLSDSVVQVQLGSCWPDRREPILLTGRFSMRSQNFEDDDDAAAAAETSALIGANFIHQQTSLIGSSQVMPKSLKVKMYLRFNESHCGPSLQEESFMLPLNIIARLVAIDYSSGQSQSLDDVQANLNPYRRQSASYAAAADEIVHQTDSPYYLCDLFIKTPSDIIEMIDEIIESDLVCRGLNSESIDYKLLLGQRKERKLSTLENINLLAQSLDCRLKYKSLSHHTATTSTAVRQSSEEYLPAVMVSIALKLPHSGQIMSGLEPVANNGVGEDSYYTTVWLHLCDLSAIDSVLPEEIVKQHMKEWKTYDVEISGANQHELSATLPSCPILVSIECDYPMPVLFIQNHLIERLRKRFVAQSNIRFQLNPLSESAHDIIEINYHDLLKMENFIAISVNLHDRLRLAMDQYESGLNNEFRRLKDELGKEYCKFHICTMTSLSLSKRLFNLPDDMHQQFNNLSLLTLQYQLNLMRILSELERLKRLDYQYSKVPSSCEIVIESIVKKVLSRLPNFAQLID